MAQAVYASMLALDGVTTVTAGYYLSPFGNAFALGGSSKQLSPLPYTLVCSLFDTTTGASGTVQIQTAPIGAGSWTTIGTLTFAALGSSLVGTHKRAGKLTTQYIRLNVSAITGGSAPYFNAYIVFGN